MKTQRQYVIATLALLLAGTIGGLAPLSHLPEVSWQTALVLLFLGIIASVLMTYLYQYGIKHGSAVTAGSMTYVGPLVAAITGPLFLNETINARILFGGILLFVGIFLSPIFPFLIHSRPKAV